MQSKVQIKSIGIDLGKITFHLIALGTRSQVGHLTLFLWRNPKRKFFSAMGFDWLSNRTSRDSVRKSPLANPKIRQFNWHAICMTCYTPESKRWAQT